MIITKSKKAQKPSFSHFFLTCIFRFLFGPTVNMDGGGETSHQGTIEILWGLFVHLMMLMAMITTGGIVWVTVRCANARLLAASFTQRPALSASRAAEAVGCRKNMSEQNSWRTSRKDAVTSRQKRINLKSGSLSQPRHLRRLHLQLTISKTGIWRLIQQHQAS